jgi:16S rRNA (uracil1498-N3)-methyltransferase
MCPGPWPPASPFELPPAVAHHLARVLRLRTGEPVELFDGKGQSALARLQSVQRDEVQVVLEGGIRIQSPPALRIRLAQALPQGDKMDWILEKAVELGASAIQPLQAQRGLVRLDAERAIRRTAHWERIIVAACSQCGQNQIPELAPLQTAAHWLAAPDSGPSEGGAALNLSPSAGLRLMLDPKGDIGLDGLADHPPPAAIDLAIGPESGWDTSELAVARQSGWTILTLGSRVLRTETAGMAMIAALQARWGDWR